MLARLVFGLLLSSLAWAQDAVPTNTSYPTQILDRTSLSLTYDMANSGFRVAYATDMSMGTITNQNATSFFLNSTLKLTTPANVGTLANNTMAYINCDAENYDQGSTGVRDTITAAASSISLAGGPPAGAILLWSARSLWCNYTAPSSFNYTRVFVIPGTAPAMITKGALEGSSMSITAQIGDPVVRGINGTTDNNTTSNTGTGNAPSTTVAMIILYSVTGVITLCFITVIVTGALRARRHPERYGLLNLPNNAHQRRARGIAQAMLETIPIIKFGEKEPMKVPTDVERGTEMQAVLATGEKLEETARENANKDAQSGGTTSAATSADHAETSRSGSTKPDAVEVEGAADVPADLDIDDNGLACSVCTDDFVKGQDLRVLPCNHKFHPECIDPWLLNVSGTCPLCRIDLRPPEEREENRNDQATGEDHQAGHPHVQFGFAPYQTNRPSTFLNRPRMGAATPAQRIRALRDLRDQRANSTTPTVDEAGNPIPIENSTAEEGTTRTRRVSRFFSRRNASPAGAGAGAGAEATPAPILAPTIDPPNANTTTSSGARRVPSLYQTSMAITRGR